jgi:hypothetical protein
MEVICPSGQFVALALSASSLRAQAKQSIAQRKEHGLLRRYRSSQ